ncbi:hypothetical protein CYMTET_50268 [Cymbomonas tetramitiformis]|uniref:Uncharacterized protein n=1 Tax=Cymbomonas tetramitiformis TaxID=36881 RepID=A0AAE0BNK1_9CHLO|nr:hypothetical protein CYMTET_50268 [Cymbomonas tetramitiformis]
MVGIRVAAAEQAVDLVGVKHDLGRRAAERVEPWNMKLVVEKFPECERLQCGLEDLAEAEGLRGAGKRKRRAEPAGSGMDAEDNEQQRAVAAGHSGDPARGLVLVKKQSRCTTWDEWDDGFTMLMCTAPEGARDLLLHFRRWMKFLAQDFSFEHVRDFYDHFTSRMAKESTVSFEMASHGGVQRQGGPGPLGGLGWPWGVFGGSSLWQRGMGTRRRRSCDRVYVLGGEQRLILPPSFAEVARPCHEVTASPVPSPLVWLGCAVGWQVVAVALLLVHELVERWEPGLKPARVPDREEAAPSSFLASTE